MIKVLSKNSFRTLAVYFQFIFVLKFIYSEECEPAYSRCNLGKEGYINVHLVSHTHDDVGWLKTVDQYFYGANTGQQEATVQYILDGVVEELAKDPKKRFVYVEIAYFWRWWNQQDDPTKQLVRTLVAEHRLEFVIGAWCMNDEATTFYNDMIDQQALGFKFILKEFGKCARPRTAWQIDPFGHSREQASLFAQFGFDGLFLGRIDYQDSDVRSNSKTREMLWQASQSLDPKLSQIFTGILPNCYNPPPGFCFDDYCDDDPIMDDPRLDGYNVDRKVQDFIEYTLNQRKIYKTDNLIMTMGSDFQYSNARRWFKNLDKTIHYVNKVQQTNNSKVNIFYSTTACYLYSLYKSNQTWTVKTDDFFPYAHRPHAFWTGYFTSRAALKDMVRRANNYLQSVRQIVSLADLNDDQTIDAIDTLERAMGIAQHHDAVSGTERQHVANDYAKRLSIGMDKCMDAVNKAFNRILLSNYGSKIIKDNKQLPMNLFYCPLLNITQCEPIENQSSFTVVVYNPLPQSINTWFNLPVSIDDYEIYEAETGDMIESENSPIYDDIKNIPERISKANFNLVFNSDIPALGFKVYSFAKPLNKIKQRKQNYFGGYENIILKNDYLQMNFDEHGNLNSINNLESSVDTKLTQSYCVYVSRPGNNSEAEFTASGAYVFRPLKDESNCLSVREFSVYRGKQFDEIHQVYNDWISQTIRLYDTSRNVEFQWQVGPIDVSDNNGKEVILRFNSDIKSNSIFYTDSNGREVLQRKRNFRPTWKLDQTENVSGNYYPVNSKIFIRDELSSLHERYNIDGTDNSRQLTLITDRSEGGSSIYDGSVEVMLHRRTLYDDALGVAEPLNEPGSDKRGLIVKGTVNLLFDTSSNSVKLHREMSRRVNFRPFITFATNDNNNNNRQSSKNKNKKTNLEKLSGISGLSKELPPNLHLLTLAKEYELNGHLHNSLLVRIEHFYELNEDKDLSNPVKLNLYDYFNQTFNIIGIEELALGANMNVEELDERLKWNAETQTQNNENPKINLKSKKNSKTSGDPFTYVFNPMQIRTFRLWYLPKFR